MLYVVAVMAEKWKIDVHGLVGMSSHYHAETTDVHANEPDFVRDVNSSVSKALNAYYGRSGRFWEDEKYHKLALLDEESQLDRLIYLYTNPVAAGLVRKHEEWPGVLTRPCFQGAYEIRVKRPGFYFREKKWPEEAVLRITPPPMCRGLSTKEFGALLFERIKAREKEIREEFRRDGREFVGRKKILRQSKERKATSVEEKPRRIPRVACVDVVKRIEWLEAVRVWEISHRVAYERKRDGAKGVLFPYGTYWWGRFGGELVEPEPG